MKTLMLATVLALSTLVQAQATETSDMIHNLTLEPPVFHRYSNFAGVEWVEVYYPDYGLYIEHYPKNKYRSEDRYEFYVRKGNGEWIQLKDSDLSYVERGILIATLNKYRE